jgi:hypothetical protein
MSWHDSTGCLDMMAQDVLWQKSFWSCTVLRLPVLSVQCTHTQWSTQMVYSIETYTMSRLPQLAHDRACRCPLGRTGTGTLTTTPLATSASISAFVIGVWIRGSIFDYSFPGSGFPLCPGLSLAILSQEQLHLETPSTVITILLVKHLAARSVEFLIENHVRNITIKRLR